MASLLAVSVILFITVYLVKPASSAGRVLIYKVSSKIFADHWLGVSA